MSPDIFSAPKTQMCFKCKKMYFACLGKTYIVEQPFFWLPGGLQLMGKGSCVKANGGG